jgi:hypothetical protein
LIWLTFLNSLLLHKNEKEKLFQERMVKSGTCFEEDYILILGLLLEPV